MGNLLKGFAALFSGINVIAGIFAGISAISSIGSGVAQQQAFNTEADALEEQGKLQQAEAEEEAIRTAKENKALRKKKALLYNFAGVTLAGSPMLVLQTQVTEDLKEETSIVNRGKAQNRLARKRADIARNKGRAAIVGGIGQGTGTLARLFA